MKFVPINKLPYDIFKEMMNDPGISKAKKKQMMEERYLKDEFNFRCL